MLSFAQATDALDKLIGRDQDFRLLGTGFGFTEGGVPPGRLASPGVAWRRR